MFKTLEIQICYRGYPYPYSKVSADVTPNLCA